MTGHTWSSVSSNHASGPTNIPPKQTMLKWTEINKNWKECLWRVFLFSCEILELSIRFENLQRKPLNRVDNWPLASMWFDIVPHVLKDDIDINNFLKIAREYSYRLMNKTVCQPKNGLKEIPKQPLAWHWSTRSIGLTTVRFWMFLIFEHVGEL